MLTLLWSQTVCVLGPLILGALPAPEGSGGLEDDPARLVIRIQAGDRAAEAELVKRFSHGLLVMLRRLAQNPALADDLHQETLSLVLEKIRRAEVREPERIAGFIRSTARNLFIADRRKEARYSPLEDDEDEGPRRVTVLADRGPVPLDKVLAGEEARQVQRLLGELRYDRDRQLLFRFYLSDDTKEEICADLEIEPERFNQVLFRARERLRELWDRAEKRQKFFAGVNKIVGRIGGEPARS
ncbi:MAG TPA: sigma-70 family RNA polymerase sigma factor [Thermoanaerobaculia bacterium]|nr:sigma-70 family RNA polymerase sigma factor [Thermoanaerobaculia bacterium]